MCYYTIIEWKKPWYIIWSVIYAHRKKIGTDNKCVKNNAEHAPELEEMELGFLNTSNKPIWEYQKYDSTSAQYVDSGEIGSVENKAEIDSDMDISDKNDLKYSWSIEIHKTLDAPA